MPEVPSEQASLISRIRTLPPLYDMGRVHRVFEDLKKAAGALEEESGQALLSILTSERHRALMSSVFGNSAFLARSALHLPERLTELCDQPPEQSLDRLVAQVLAGSRQAQSPAEVMRLLRFAKIEAALLIAFADVGGVWDLGQVTGALTRFADACVQATLRYLLCEAEEAGQLTISNRAQSEKDCGLVVMAMGKYGAAELNYSSDIDITIYFDDEKLDLQSGVEPRQFCVKLTKEIVRYLQDVTEDGYVFRVDLRLRPDAGATSVALSVAAAEQYYESMGQNWERAAMIKARPAAGDLDVGRHFLEVLTPFIWRKYLDYAAIEDIHSIKRQIHASGGHKAIAAAGHDIKLGLGGIREIEFFVQTQQLIMGGRNKNLRNPTTCGGLDDFVREGIVDASTAEELKNSYTFLRHVEHRLQMREDAQTHTVPSQESDLNEVARFSGYVRTEDFITDLLGHLRRVNDHYSDLFAKSDPLASEEGSLVFTGVDDDPETIETLLRMGFDRPGVVSATIRGWHFGRIRATRSERARELLTKLGPVILEAISKTSNPNETFARFHDFLSGLPAGVQLFSLFYSHPELLYLVIDTLGLAPRLGTYLAKNAGVLDALLDPDFLTHLPARAEMQNQVREFLAGEEDFERALDEARRWGKEQMFRVGLTVLRGAIGAEGAGSAYADIADVLLVGLSDLAKKDIERTHGVIQGTRFAVIGMGKLGGRELTATSDLDLIVVYDAPQDIGRSDGIRPLTPPRYFSRYAQRLIAAVSAPTAEGTLYEVDMNLRPSGKSGPIASQLSSFQRYFEREAWTWEKMALTRARLITGETTLVNTLRQTITHVLCARRDVHSLAHDINEMRQRIKLQKGAKNPWDLKQVRGGLIDLEFICQYLQLAHAHVHPEVLDQNTYKAFQKIGKAQLISREMARGLIDATDFLQNLSQITRTALSGVFRPEEAGKSLKNLLTRSSGLESFQQLDEKLRVTQSFVKSTYDAVLRASAT